MSLQEDYEQAEAVRVLLMPKLGFSATKEGDFPTSLRAYHLLRPVIPAILEQAAGFTDNDDTVIAPAGGHIQVGHSKEDESGFTLDDIIAIPELAGLSDIVLYNQIPLMVFEKPGQEHDPMLEYDFGRLPIVSDYVSSVKGQEKPEEMVLAINSADFIEALLYNNDDHRPNHVEDSLYSNLSFVRRDWCEKDTRFIQLLPYIIFFKKIDGEYYLFVYQRGKGVGEERLAGGCSVGVGGHINPLDFFSIQSRMKITPYSSVQEMTGRMLVEGFWKGILNNVYREGDEEISIVDGAVRILSLEALIGQWSNEEAVSPEVWLHRRTSFFLDYASGDVEKTHLGMFIAIELPEDFEVVTKEEELNDVGFKSLNDLYANLDNPVLPTPLEIWSMAIVDSLADTLDFKKARGIKGYDGSFVSDSKMASGGHAISAEDASHILPAYRWGIGTLAGSFDPMLRFYSMNAFLRLPK